MTAVVCQRKALAIPQPIITHLTHTFGDCNVSTTYMAIIQLPVSFVKSSSKLDSLKSSRSPSDCLKEVCSADRLDVDQI